MPFDSAAVLSPGTETADGHHGAAIDAALREVMGDTCDRPPTEHRIACRKLVVLPGELRAPPGGLHIQSIRQLEIEGDHANLVGDGDIEAVLRIDGCADGYAKGLTVQSRRAFGAGRMEVPRDVVQIHKSQESHQYPPQSHFRFDGKVSGVWREAGIRAGSAGWTTAQEDHYAGRVAIYGQHELNGADDLCKVGLICGNETWGNNRRHNWEEVKVAWCVAGVKSLFSAEVSIGYLVLDGVRDMILASGGRKFTVHAGEAEVCQRFVVDGLWSGHDLTLSVNNFHAKLGAWHPELPLPISWDDAKYKNAIGTWGTRGGLLLNNVSFADLPVRRAPDGKLYYYHHAEERLTTIPAPRLWSTQPLANIYTRNCSAHGYRAKPGANEFFAFEPQGCGMARHELWKDTDVDGTVRQHQLQAINQYYKPA